MAQDATAFSLESINKQDFCCLLSALYGTQLASMLYLAALNELLNILYCQHSRSVR